MYKIEDSFKKSFIDDIITALATPDGVGAVAVIRVSGQGCHEILKFIFRKGLPSSDNCKKEKSVKIDSDIVFKPGQFRLGYIYDSDNSRVLDQIILLVMKSPRSYTGEDSFEIQCHGGPAIVTSIINLLLSVGVRMAEPGEFTRRAVLNKRMDLVQAESILNLVNAGTAAARDSAIENLGGALSSMINKLSDNLIDLAAWLEALIDFPEDDVDEIDKLEKKELLFGIVNQIRDLTLTYDTGRILRDGISVCMLGRVNVGKSSLMNALTGTNKSIVTPLAGTTRDIVEGQFRGRGVFIRLSDTAGLRSSGDIVEKQGVRRALEKAAEADCLMIVLDSSIELNGLDKRIIRRVIKSGKPYIVVLNKVDLPEEADYLGLSDICDKSPVEVSAVKGINLDLIIESIGNTMKHRIPENRGVMISSARQMRALSESLEILKEVLELMDAEENFDITATQIRTAVRILDAITGGISDQQILDRLFSRFCIGK